MGMPRPWQQVLTGGWRLEQILKFVRQSTVKIIHRFLYDGTVRTYVRPTLLRMRALQQQSTRLVRQKLRSFFVGTYM